MAKDELVVIDKINPVVLFTERHELESLISGLRKKSLEMAGGYSVEKATGRKQIASVAYKVSRSKTLLDAAGKDLVRGWKEKAKKVDIARKQLRDELDALRDEIRQPVTEWEEAERLRIEQEKAAEEYARAWDEAHAEHELWLRQKAIEKREAELARQEAERIAEEERRKAEQAAKEREERLKKEAAEQAKREAEEAAQRKIMEAEIRAQQEREAKERAERERIAAEERAKIEKEQAIARAREEERRKEYARREAEAAKERARIEAEARKAANKKHRKAVNNKALAAFVAGGIEKEVAKAVIILVADGKIPNMTINY